MLDRPKGSRHPRFKERAYPVNYGYLNGTTAIDAGGVDVWLGSTGEKRVVGILCTVDLHKRDTELKIVLGCSDREISQILKFTNSGEMRAMFIKQSS